MRTPALGHGQRGIHTDRDDATDHAIPRSARKPGFRYAKASAQRNFRRLEVCPWIKIEDANPAKPLKRVWNVLICRNVP